MGLVLQMTADVIAENRVKVLDVLASLESSPEDEAVLVSLTCMCSSTRHWQRSAADETPSQSICWTGAVSHAQTDGLISAYHPKEVVDVVSLDTGNNKALCNQVSSATTRVWERMWWWC